MLNHHRLRPRHKAVGIFTVLIRSARKQERQEKIRKALPRLIERLRELTDTETKIILIKSNVFVIAAEPLRQAGFSVLNTELVDYPGQYNQRAYRDKLAKLVSLC